MRQKILLAVLMGALCGPPSAYCQSLHVISVAQLDSAWARKTGLADIGSGTTANSDGLRSYAKLVSAYTGLPLNFVEVKGGEDFSCAAINRAVRDLQPK